MLGQLTKWGGLAAVMTAVVVAGGIGGPLEAAVFTVNSTGDGADGNPGDGSCNDGSGNCTLRAAIQEANALGLTDSIYFDISGAGPHTITPASFLPTITDPVVIDGTTEPDFSNVPVVELDGSTALGVGLYVTAGNSVVRGLAINRFAFGVLLQTNGNNRIEGCHIGTDVSGTVDRGNTTAGVSVLNSPSNTIGGTAAGSGNLISGNDGVGVRLDSAAATGNIVVGNKIGTDITGAVDLGNGVAGILLNGVSNNTVGGASVGARNTISGNDFYGVWMFGVGATGNAVLGNYIGTDANGTADLGNSSVGVFIDRAPGNTVGGAVAGARNIISGNDAYGVRIDSAAATGNSVLGNYIGTDFNGTADLGNTTAGILIDAAPNNTLGSTSAGTGNTISGNDLHGIWINGAATGNSVLGNYIGTDANGTADLGNTVDGVFVLEAPGNTIGGTTAAARNIISGNDAFGVRIFQVDATANTIAGNYIGTDVTGAIGLGNSVAGITINQAPGNTIGGTVSGAGNVISGNGLLGISITRTTASANIVAGNFIGTDAGGTAALGNGQIGIWIVEAPGNTIGGTTAGARNIISGNDSCGVRIDSVEATGNLVQGNYIGTDVNGTAALGNGRDGVYLFEAPGNTIGGTASGAGNLISGNDRNGIAIVGNSATGNAFLGNRIFANTLAGIDLIDDGVTANDAGDGDTGPNNLQNFPVLTAVTLGSLSISGSLNSTPSTTFRLEFFASSTCEVSNFGEGEFFLGSVDVTTDGNGNANFATSVSTAAFSAPFITATATDVGNNTSEFSQCITVTPPVLTSFSGLSAPPFVPTLDWGDVGGAASYTLEYADNPGFSPSTLAAGLSASQFTFPGPIADGTYHWRVKAVGTSFESPFSTADSFVVIPTFTEWTAILLALGMVGYLVWHWR